jgi:exodeoxyribonuclease-5
MDQREETYMQAVRANFGFEFTSDQNAALRTFYTFFTDTYARKVWQLSGFAGTGKSSMVSALVKTLKQEKIGFKLLAPTGRAAKVLSNFAGYPASTIHKQIYFSGNELTNAKITPAKNLYKNTLFFVDESSMISNESEYEGPNVLMDLMNYVFQGVNCQLIFIGDLGQLPPVGQEESIALNAEAFQAMFPTVRVFASQLSEVVRVQEHSAILKNATFIREQADYVTPFIHEIDEQSTFRCEGGEFQEWIESSIDQVGVEDTIVLTLSNKRANQWNQEIRKRLFYREDVLERGDLLMIVKNNYFWLDPASVMGFIANGELARVERVRKVEQQYGFEFVHVDLSFVDYPEVPSITVIVHTASLTEESPNLKRDKLSQLFYAIEKDFSDERVKNKRYQKIMKSPYFNALQIKYAHAVTVHKAQGGQWKHVYIDYGFIPEEMKSKNYLRWLYTSVTRATEKLTFLNFPKEAFRQLIDG